jgi:hypothetical protein
VQHCNGFFLEITLQEKANLGCAIIPSYHVLTGLTSTRAKIDIQTFTEGMTCLSSEVFILVEAKYHPECIQYPG